MKGWAVVVSELGKQGGSGPEDVPHGCRQSPDPSGTQGMPWSAEGCCDLLMASQ